MDRLARLRRTAASPAGVLASATLLFAGIFALRLAVESPGEAVGMLFAAPVALLAIRFGPGAGLAAGAFALGLIAIWVAVEDAELGALGWFSRAAVLVLAGGALGEYARRLRHASAADGGPRALRHGGAVFQVAEEAAAMGSWEWDLRTGVQRWSNGLYRLFGLEPQSVEPTFETFLEMVHPEDRGIVSTAGRRAREEGVATTSEFRIVRPDGEARVLEGVGEALRDPSGEVGAIIGTTRDVTERKRAERELAEAAAERARVEQTRQLLQITDVALASLPLDDLLTELLDRVCEALPADSAAILMREEPGDELILRAVHGLEGPGPGEPPLSASSGLAARVMRERRPVLLVGEEVAEVRLTALRRMGAVAGAPLIAGGRVIGVLEVGRREPPPIAGGDLALLQLAADRSALAVDHARTFERERHIASTLQQSLLPEELPEIPGIDLQARFLPAGEGQQVGGDFYDAFGLDADRWLMVLGDVCGKGPEAAAFTALVRYTLRAEAIHEPRPGELLGLLNDAILVHTTDLRFCTAVCLRLDTAESAPSLTIAAGGHPMPLVIRANGAIEPPPRSGGPLIGAIPGAEFDEWRYGLSSGDTVVAYTDGLLEAYAPEQILQPADLADAARSLPTRPLWAFMQALEDAALGGGAVPARDDIAMLALAIGGVPPPVTDAPGGRLADVP